MKKQLSLLLFYVLVAGCAPSAQMVFGKEEYTRQDSLRGTLNSYRVWWNVLRYNITVSPDFTSRTIKGKTEMVYEETSEGHTMQIDLQQPMAIDSIVQSGQQVSYKREENVYWVFIRDSTKRTRVKKGNNSMTIYFKGMPRPALNPPWDGGWIWTKDKKGRPWMTVACQGLGASVWYPCKDHQSDEPDSGALLTVIVPDTLVAIANGKLKNKTVNNKLASYTWEVKNPINNYNLVPYIGKYVNWTETYKGEKGPLICSYWVLDYNLNKAKQQFTQVAPTLKAMEYWFGPYPFYEDDYKLVETPHLGMEHQSAVAYGNEYKNGYKGTDLSGTGWGLKWDYIIVHETGHEWFGNNITTKDIADMWVHEGFTDYSETLFVEQLYGKAAAQEYCLGLRKNIQNDKPIIGPYGVNREGSTDMYYKGANLIHTVRQVINDDRKFRDILRGLNKTFYHQTVTTAEVENYISAQSGKDLSKVFHQYLRNRQVPLLKLDADGDGLKFKWANCIEGFNMPVKLSNGQWINPTTTWQELKMERKVAAVLTADPAFYIRVKQDD